MGILAVKVGRKLPSTRYLGSKRKLVDWIWSHIGHLDFDVFLDAFGGTGVVGYYAKMHGKKVIYNDILRFNYMVGLAIIENDSVRLSEEDVEFISSYHEEITYPSFIADTFSGLYYTDEENRWLDMAVTNIMALEDTYKRALAFSALGQACLVKRPFNLFHRANLSMRLRNVKRSFGNHITWNRPFEELFRRFVAELNEAVFSNGRRNLALNMDVFELDVDADLVYLDPPYVPARGEVPDYRLYYHFLEGLVNYDRWAEMIDPGSPLKAIKRDPSPWADRARVRDAFRQVLKKFDYADHIVISYRPDGIPSPGEIVGMLRRLGREVQVHRKHYKYALSPKDREELLFVAS